MSSITARSPTKLALPSTLRKAADVLSRWSAWAGQGRAGRQLKAERAAEAAAVREYAQRFARHDPRFAADLLAAADRHERTD
jgi:hypothetical protein